MLQWYLATTKLKNELRAKQNLWANHQLETFFPVYKAKKATSPIGLPLFPRYIFVHCDLDRDFQKVQFSPGIVGLVAFGEQRFIPVEEDVITCLKMRCDEHDQIIPEDLSEGQAVRVKAGVFEGCEGIISEKRGNKRVQLLLELAYKGLKIELDVSQVEASTVQCQR